VDGEWEGCGKSITVLLCCSFLLTVFSYFSVRLPWAALLQETSVRSSMASFPSALMWTSAPSWSSPQAAEEPLLWNPEHLLAFLSLSPWCLQGCFFHIVFSVLSLNSCTAGFLPFAKYIYPEMPPSWLRGSAVSCSGSTRVCWSWLCLAQGSPCPLPFPAAPQPAKSCHLHPVKIRIMELCNYSEYLDKK